MNFSPLLHPKDACENRKYCIALEKKEQIVKLVKYWEDQTNAWMGRLWEFTEDYDMTLLII